MTSADVSHVVAAVIRREGKFLICQRPLQKRHGGLWELPGGKVEAGETFLEALRRELSEELSVQVRRIGTTYYAIQDPGSAFVIHFVETHIDGTPQAVEHEQLAWVSPEQLLTYNLAHSDRAFARFLLGQG